MTFNCSLSVLALSALALHTCTVVSLHVHSRMAGEGWEKARALLLEAVESLAQVAPTLQPPGNSVSNPGTSGYSGSTRASPVVQPPSGSSGYSKFTRASPVVQPPSGSSGCSGSTRTLQPPSGSSGYSGSIHASPTVQPPSGSSGYSGSTRASPTVQPPNGSSGCSGDSALRERNRLFHFGFRRKGGPKSKKKRLHSWKHEFICLASTSCSRVPSGIEMAS